MTDIGTKLTNEMLARFEHVMFHNADRDFARQIKASVYGTMSTLRDRDGYAQDVAFAHALRMNGFSYIVDRASKDVFACK